MSKSEMPIMAHFTFDHLPPHLREVSEPFCVLAREMHDTLPGCAEKSAGLRKLLEAKDCAVRAALTPVNPDPHPRAPAPTTKDEIRRIVRDVLSEDAQR